MLHLKQAQTTHIYRLFYLLLFRNEPNIMWPFWVLTKPLLINCLLVISFSFREIAEMASSLSNRLSEHLTCPVCLEKYTDPRELSCQHVYCKMCLAGLLTVEGSQYLIRCPECRLETEVQCKAFIPVPTTKLKYLKVKTLYDKHELSFDPI